MTALVPALKQARVVAAESAVGLTKDLEGVWLSSMSVAPWREGGYALATLDQMIADCERRLAKAQEINHSRPGIPRVTTDPYGYQYVDRVVSFEEDDLATADADAAATLLTQIMDGTIHVEDGLPQELVSMLLAGMDDPVFAHRLTDRVPPDMFAHMLTLIQINRGNLVHDCGDQSAELAGFDLGYAQALDMLGAVYSLEARSLPPGSVAAQDYLTQWERIFFSAPAHALTPSLMALVVGRGRWPDEFLTGITDAITVTEGKMGVAYWGEPESLNPDPGWPVADPGRTYQDGHRVEVGDPMVGVWLAAVNNPGWMAAHYQNGTQVEVTIDRTGYDGSRFSTTIPETVWVDKRIAGLFQSRGMDEASLNAFLMAGSVSDTTTILAGGTPMLMDDIVSMGAAMDREQRLFDELPWWTKHGHTILETVSAVAGVAAMIIPGPGWATGAALLSLGLSTTDVIWYTADGDIPDAILTGALLLIPVVIGGTIRMVQILKTDLTILKAGGTLEIGGRVLFMDDIGTVRVMDSLPKTKPPIKAPPDSPFHATVQEIRDSLPSNPRRSGNVAVADVDIAGLPTEFKAHSRINTPTGNEAAKAEQDKYPFSYEKNANDRVLLGYQMVNDIDRAVDTEAKILEDIASRTTRESTGTVVLYTERYPCLSCQEVINYFQMIRPNIILTIIYG